MPTQDPLDGTANRSPGAMPYVPPGLDCPFEIDFQVLSDRLGEVPDEANALLQLLDGRRTLREAFAAAEDATQAAAAASDLSALGVIRPAGGSGAFRPAGGSAPEVAVESAANRSAEGAAAAPRGLVGGAGGGAAASGGWAEGSGAGGPPGTRTNAPSASGVGAAPPRIVRFPARRKNLPPAPGRVGVSALGEPTVTDLASAAIGAAMDRGGARRSGSTDLAVAGPQRRRPQGAGDDAAPGQRTHKLAGALLVAGALVAALLSALVFMHRS